MRPLGLGLPYGWDQVCNDDMYIYASTKKNHVLNIKVLNRPSIKQSQQFSFYIPVWQWANLPTQTTHRFKSKTAGDSTDKPQLYSTRTTAIPSIPKMIANKFPPKDDNTLIPLPPYVRQHDTPAHSVRRNSFSPDKRVVENRDLVGRCCSISSN
jgi:hypothetical protein